MQRLGFIHDMLDVKVMILFVMARVGYSVNTQQIYELCYQDDCLSYCDVFTAVPEMVASGHLNAVSRFNRQIRRSSFVKTQILPRESGEFSVIMALDDEMGNLMTLELVAPDQRQAVRLGKLFEKKAEAVYNLTMAELLDEEDDL